MILGLTEGDMKSLDYSSRGVVEGPVPFLGCI